MDCEMLLLCKMLLLLCIVITSGTMLLAHRIEQIFKNMRDEA